MKARTDSTYVNAGILTPEEVRARLAADKGNEYNDLSEELLEELDLSGEKHGYGFGGMSGNNADGGGFGGTAKRKAGRYVQDCQWQHISSFKKTGGRTQRELFCRF